MGRCDSGKRIRVSGPAGYERESGLAMDARPTVGGVCNAGFVPLVNDPHSSLGQSQQDFIQMIPNKSEDRINSKFDNRGSK